MCRLDTHRRLRYPRNGLVVSNFASQALRGDPITISELLAAPAPEPVARPLISGTNNRSLVASRWLRVRNSK